jgi:hypothetical protein
MKRSAWGHPKFKHLAELLHIDIWGAYGLCESLWHFTARYAPRGDVGRFSIEQVAAGIAWRKSPETLFEAFRIAQLVDPDERGRPWYVHDWHEHAEDAVNRFLIRRNETYANGAPPRRKGATDSYLDETLSLHDQSRRDKSLLPLPVPVPVPKPCPPLPPEGAVGGDDVHRVLKQSAALRSLTYEQDLMARKVWEGWRRSLTPKIAEMIAERAEVDLPHSAGAWLRRQYDKLARAEANGVVLATADVRAVLQGMLRPEKQTADGPSLVFARGFPSA